ncbi:PREDICTED: uncharacterized protein LOC105853941 [Condylura cristata]|uniref:uncharacterized protein LOC105853941 n=1 Tax=Condylura cristata TaxID=143302 RepID=UPI00064350D7|nr:PREDICTED: uncharacterized protein LOC105853941 [Condylura cristata]
MEEPFKIPLGSSISHLGKDDFLEAAGFLAMEGLAGNGPLGGLCGHGSLVGMNEVLKSWIPLGKLNWMLSSLSVAKLNVTINVLLTLHQNSYGHVLFLPNSCQSVCTDIHLCPMVEFWFRIINQDMNKLKSVQDKLKTDLKDTPDSSVSQQAKQTGEKVGLKLTNADILDVKLELTPEGDGLNLRVPITANVNLKLPGTDELVNLKASLDVLKGVKIEKDAQTGLPKVVPGKCAVDPVSIQLHLLGRKSLLINTLLDSVSGLVGKTLSGLVEKLVCPLLSFLTQNMSVDFVLDTIADQDKLKPDPKASQDASVLQQDTQAFPQTGNLLENGIYDLLPPEARALGLTISNLRILSPKYELSPDGQSLNMRTPITADVNLKLPVIGQLVNLKASLDLMRGVRIRKDAQTGQLTVVPGKCSVNPVSIQLNLLGRKISLINTLLDGVTGLVDKALSLVVEKLVCPTLSSIIQKLNVDFVQDTIDCSHCCAPQRVSLSEDAATPDRNKSPSPARRTLLKLKNADILDIKLELTPEGDGLNLRVPITANVNLKLPDSDELVNLKFSLDVLKGVKIEKDAETGLSKVVPGKCAVDPVSIQLHLLGRKSRLVNTLLDGVTGLVGKTLAGLVEKLVCPLLSFLTHNMSVDFVQDTIADQENLEPDLKASQDASILQKVKQRVLQIKNLENVDLHLLSPEVLTLGPVIGQLVNLTSSLDILSSVRIIEDDEPYQNSVVMEQCTVDPDSVQLKLLSREAEDKQFDQHICGPWTRVGEKGSVQRGSKYRESGIPGARVWPVCQLLNLCLYSQSEIIGKIIDDTVTPDADPWLQRGNITPILQRMPTLPTDDEEPKA